MPRRCFSALLFASLLPLPAYAHMGNLAIGDFWLGVLHPLATLENALTILALGLLAGQAGEAAGIQVVRWFIPLLVSGAVVATFGVHGVWIYGINLALLLPLGALVALGLRLPQWVLISLAAACGLSIGLANGEEIAGSVKAWQFIPGLVLSGMLSLFYIMAAVSRLKPWWTRVAVRVVGSWVAAVGLLVGALNTLPHASV